MSTNTEATARCKPLVSHNNGMYRLQFVVKCLKEPIEFWKKVSWTDKIQDPKHSSSSVKRGGGGVMAWACMAATGTGTLIFIDDGTANGSCTMNSEASEASDLLKFL